MLWQNMGLTIYYTIQTYNEKEPLENFVGKGENAGNNDPEKEALENFVGKGENAGNQHFLLFPQCFLPIP